MISYNSIFQFLVISCAKVEFAILLIMISIEALYICLCLCNPTYNDIILKVLKHFVFVYVFVFVILLIMISRRPSSLYACLRVYSNA